MNHTRSGEMVSAQIGKMGVISGLQDGDFSLPDGQCFNVKNDGTQAVSLEVRLPGMASDEFVETMFEVGWNPEIIKTMKQTSLSGLNLKWGINMGLLIGVGSTRPQFAYDYWYGIEWDVTVSNPLCTRIGKLELHQSLPIQSLMRRCVLKDDGTVNYYLHPNDSTLRDNSAAANLDGTDGQVMVEIPDMWVRFEMDGNIRRCLMSDRALPGFIKWSKDYVSAYEATVDRTAAATPKLVSVVNSNDNCCFGFWDSIFVFSNFYTIFALVKKILIVL